MISTHGGGMGGIEAMMIDLPDRGLSLAVLGNCTDKATRDAVVRHLMDGLAPEFDPGHLHPITAEARDFALAPGGWAGSVETPDGEIPLHVEVLTEQRAAVRLADLPPVTVPAYSSTKWDLSVYADLQLPTAGALPNSPSFGLELRAEDGGLTGRAVAYKSGDREGLLGPYLVHACRLRPAG